MPYTLLQPGTIEAIQTEQAAVHGGSTTMRSPDLIQILLDRAIALNESAATDLASLAACYAYGLAHGKPFHDGNLSTALICTELFLTINGHRLLADDSTCVLGFSVLADGELSAESFTNWVRTHIAPREEAVF
jgi:death-on-curing protein